MRWLIALIVILLAVYHFWPEPEPVPVEESFIAAPVQALEDAKGFEDDYLKAEEARKKRMEEELERQGG